MIERGIGENRDKLKAVIKRLHDGASVKDVKKEFADVIKGASAVEVAAMEQSLIDEGFPVSEIQRLCDVHAETFKAALEKGAKPHTLSGHPVHSYMAENRVARKRIRALLFSTLRPGTEALREAVEGLRPIIRHYQRKENQLFPFLERSGFTGPSKVMWGKHDEVRDAFREIDAAVGRGSAAEAKRLARALAAKTRSLVFMEEKILFPNALSRLSEPDWARIRSGEDAIGFAWVKPGADWDPGLARGTSADGIRQETAAKDPTGAVSSGDVALGVGTLSVEVLDKMLRQLPMDVSFVDADDKVRYYSDSPDRVFPRSPGVIGREVKNCHPPKSVATVTRILDSFRRKEKDKAEFWIELHGRFIHISYVPVYGDDGSYLGTLETSMDATELRALKGERRLLDWA